jgi:hypothetical protein
MRFNCAELNLHATQHSFQPNRHNGQDCKRNGHAKKAKRNLHRPQRASKLKFANTIKSLQRGLFCDEHNRITKILKKESTETAQNSSAQNFMYHR